MLSGIEGPLPCDVHEVMGAGAAQSDNAGFGKRGREPVAEQGHLISERHLVKRQVIRMDVHVPEAGHQVPAFEIDHLRVAAGAVRLLVSRHHRALLGIWFIGEVSRSYWRVCQPRA